MSVQLVEVAAEFDGQKLDKWFKQHYPGLRFGPLSKLMRTGQIRVDSKRVKPDTRLKAGQVLRIPPLQPEALIEAPAPRRTGLSEADASMLEQAVVYEDDELIALNKPQGLAVQGGSNTTKHLDAMMTAWRRDFKPRLVHRLDKDTSGLLLFAKSVGAANRLTLAFRKSQVVKTYWAIVVGRPPMMKGIIKASLAKQAGSGPGGEKVVVDPNGQQAMTAYQILDRAGKRAAWVALTPQSGRTHQLRVHCLHMGTPILGDGKYGGQDAFLEGLNLPKTMHLHARELLLPHREFGELRLSADIPAHMRESFQLLGFNTGDAAELTEDAPWL